MNVKFMMPDAIVLLLLSCVFSTAMAEELLPLSKGYYRFEGACKSMIFIDDSTAECQPFSGIDATNPALPVFIFPRRNNGGWLFSSSKEGVSSDDGHVWTYQVSQVLDMSAQRAFNYDDGECVLDNRAPGPNVTCTIWRDASRGHAVWQAVFLGNGNWRFSRGK